MSKKLSIEAAPLIQVPIQTSHYTSNEHKLRVSGLEDYVHTIKSFVTIDRDGKEFKRNIDIKKIKNDFYEVNSLTVDSHEYEESINTNLAPDKLAEFKLEWDKNWKVSQWPEPTNTPSLS